MKNLKSLEITENNLSEINVIDNLVPVDQYKNPHFQFPGSSRYPHLPCSVCGKLSRIMNPKFKSPFTLCDEHLSDYLNNSQGGDNMETTTTNENNVDLSGMENPAPIKAGELVLDQDVLADLEKEEKLKSNPDKNRSQQDLANRFVSLPLDRLVIDGNIREDVGSEESLRVLGESIKRHGLMQPIIVKADRKSGKFHVIAGQRRFLAAKLVGLKDIPTRSLKNELKDETVIALQWIENENRKQMNVYEKARAVKVMSEEYEKDVAEIAHELGIKQKKVKIFLRMWTLIPELQELVKCNVINRPSTLEMLVTLPNDLQISVYDEYKESNRDDFFSVRELRRYLKDQRFAMSEQNTTPNLPMMDVGYPTTEHELREERCFQPQAPAQNKARLVCTSGDFVELFEAENGVVKIKMNGNVIGNLDLSGVLEVPNIKVKVKSDDQIVK